MLARLCFSRVKKLGGGAIFSLVWFSSGWLLTFSSEEEDDDDDDFDFYSNPQRRINEMSWEGNGGKGKLK